MQSAEDGGTSSSVVSAVAEAAVAAVVVNSAPQQTIAAGQVMEEEASVSVAPNTQTCRQESGKGVKCIISGGGRVTFVLNPPHAHGRTFLPQGRKNETGTSPVLHKISYFSIPYIKTNMFRKYME